MAFYLISFSPTGGTHRAAGLFAQSFSKECIPVDLTDRTLTFSGIPFSKQDICLAAVPAYGGRVPCPAAARLAQMHGAHLPGKGGELGGIRCIGPPGGKLRKNRVPRHSRYAGRTAKARGGEDVI